MRLAHPFVVAPAHCGKMALQNGGSAEFGVKGVVMGLLPVHPFLVTIYYMCGAYFSDLIKDFYLVIGQKNPHV